MEISQLALGVLCIASFLSGMILCVGYDALAVLPVIFGKTYSPALKKKLSAVKMPLEFSFSGKKAFLSAAVFLHDFIFMIIAGAIFTLVVYRFNDGVFRAAAPISLISGFAVCRICFRRFVTPLAEISGFLVRYALSAVAFVLIMPVLKLLKLVKKALAKKRSVSLQKKIERYTKNEKLWLLSSVESGGGFTLGRNVKNGKKKNEHNNFVGDSGSFGPLGNSHRDQYNELQPKEAGSGAARKRKRSA